MPKLFVAIDLPGGTRSELARLQPPPGPGLRVVAPDQMHLTVHFVADADLDRVDGVLRDVSFPPFDLSFDGVGTFPTAGGSTTLWAGVEAGSDLIRFHQELGRALAGTGCRLETRAYVPHVTLARSAAGSPGVFDAFVARNAGFRLPPVRAAGWGVYSSSFVNDAPVYRNERAYCFA